MFDFLKLVKIALCLDTSVFQSNVAAAVVGGVASSAISASSAGDAADAQTSAANRANDTQLQMFNQSQANLAPYNQIGQNAAGTLSAALGLGTYVPASSSTTTTTTGGGGQSGGPMTPQSYLAQAYALPRSQAAQNGSIGNTTTTTTNTPASFTAGGGTPTIGGEFTNADLNANMAPNYAFQLQQGQNALQNSQAAQNGVLSGAALKDMQNYVQGTAAGAYQNAYNNWLTTNQMNYNNLYNLASLGANAASTSGNQAIQSGSIMGQNTIGAGNAQAAGSIAQGNALSGGINNAMNYMMLNNMNNTGSFF